MSLEINTDLAYPFKNSLIQYHIDFFRQLDRLRMRSDNFITERKASVITDPLGVQISIG